MSSELDVEIVDFIDLVNYTLSQDFINKWKYRFNTRFLKEFQGKIFKALKDKKPLKKSSVYNHLVKKLKYSTEQVDNFFEAIDISIYRPLISG
jgi:hypothetical protein